MGTYQSINNSKGTHTGSTIYIFFFLVFTRDLKNPMPSSLITPWFAPGCHPCPSSLPQCVLIRCLFVGLLTLQAPQSSGQPSFFTGKRFLWFAFPCSCWLISHIGILLWGGEWWRVSVWVWACVHLCVWAHVERADHCSCWRWIKKPTHTAGS